MTRERISQLWRIAASVSRHAERASVGPTPDELPQVAWTGCQRLWRQAETARERGWRTAEGRARRRLARAVGDCRRQLAAVEESLAEASPRPAATREVFDDLVALETEFCRVVFDLQATELAVRTEAIVLDGIRLGQFDVVLNWSRLAARFEAYWIEGVDSNPSTVDSDVIHPHVRDGTLCAGEASSAIMAALASGRLLDFFTVVARTLATYNPLSPFVALDRWHGVSCTDCGSVTGEDDRTCCERCECDLCDYCSASCQECGCTVCGDCSAACTGCQHGHCCDCLKPCQRCSQRFCQGCQTDDLCEKCRETFDDESDGEAPAHHQAVPASAPPVALCVGQAGAPA